MRSVLRTIALVCALLASLTACSAEQPAIDVMDIDASLKVEPAAAGIGEEVRIKVEIVGVPITKSSDVTLIAVENGKAKLLDAKFEGDGVFTAVHSFTQSGKHDVDLHVTASGIHFMKKKQVEVK